MTRGGRSSQTCQTVQIIPGSWIESRQSGETRYRG